jgi:hypothetical protein
VLKVAENAQEEKKKSCSGVGGTIHCGLAGKSLYADGPDARTSADRVRSFDL